MNHTATASASSVEYLIYTFEFPQDGQRGHSPWHRYAALADEDLALAQAQILSDTNKYRRIEVKKKYFDTKHGRAIDTTLRVYESGIERTKANLIGFLLGIAAIAAAAMTIAALV